MGQKEPQQRMNRLPILTFFILFLSLLCFIFPGVAAVLIFDRTAILKGEVWRLFSSHWVHFTAPHLAYNLLAFGVAGWVVEKKSRFQLGLLYGVMAGVICTALLVFRPAMIYYGGLSGTACGLIYYCALLKMKEPGPWSVICQGIILCLPVKIMIEIYTTASVLPYGEHPPFLMMPISHVAGTGVAVLFYIGVNSIQRHTRHRLDPGPNPVT